MKLNSESLRPRSLRRPALAVAMGIGSALFSTAATARDADQGAAPDAAQGAAQDRAEDLGVAEYKDYTADSNPYTSNGAPYKARVSGDSRRVKPLAETPATITVITQAQIKESGRTDLKAILQAQPGVTIGTGENGNKFGDRYILRGQELKSDVFVDGLRDPGMTMRESFNVEQVELTKGPSSTFAGRGSSGGAVNAITKKATTDYDFTSVDVTGGTDNYIRTTADVNLAFGEKFAVRANGLYGSEDVPERAPANRKRFGAAVSALFKPTDTLSLVLDYYHLTAHDRPDLGKYFTGAGGTIVSDVPSYSQDNDFARSIVNVGTGHLKWELSPAFRIENSLRYGQAHNGYVNTGARNSTLYGTTTSVMTLDNGHQGWQDIDYLADQLNLIGEVNVAGMKHSLVGGVELSHNRVINGSYTLTNTNATNCQTRSNSGTATNSYCVFPGATNISGLTGRTYTQGAWTTDWEVDTRSIYLMDTIDVARWLTLFGGVRLDSYDYKLKVQSSGTITPYANSGDLWNWHGGISVKPTESGQVYFSVGTAKNINGGESDVGTSSGYGGFCTVTGTNNYGKPVKTTNYEVGSKWEMFDHRFMVTAAAFHLIKDGVCQSATQDAYSQNGTLNTGKYKVEGLEFGLVGNLTSRLSGQAGLTWMDSKILASTTVTDIGYKLANFADFQANAQVKYQLTDAFAIGGNVNHKSSMATGQPDTAAVHDATTGAYSYNIPAYTTFDAFATYKVNQHFDVRVNVQNLGNVDYYVAGYRGGSFVYIGDKRRATVTLTGRF